TVEPFLRVDLEMFSRGGLAILDAIEASGYDTLQHRPALTKWAQVRLLTHALASRVFSRGANLPVYERGTTSAEADPVIRRSSHSVAVMRSGAEGVAASYAECARIARESRSSFYLAFFGLRKEKRNALCALYAFMRLVDNVSDEPGDLDSKREGLARWRRMLDDAIAGRASANAILPALADT